MRRAARVQDVIGGDSLRAAHEPLIGEGLEGETLAVRLAAVYCPQMPSEPLAQEAVQFVNERVLGRNVRLQLVSAGGEKGVLLVLWQGVVLVACTDMPVYKQKILCDRSKAVLLHHILQYSSVYRVHCSERSQQTAPQERQRPNRHTDKRQLCI